MSDFARACLAAWREPDPARKSAQVAALPEATAVPPQPGLGREPGRPTRPLLVAPRALRKRKLGSAAGRTALVHAIAHIEFNAINLALDAILRFPDMPDAYRADWLSVAQDEARHYSMLADRLRQMGSHYGALDAHDGLWEMARKTADDVLLRMALVPRVLEARGLDVTPGMIRRLRAAGDEDTAALLCVILEEEVRHVRIGSHWFRLLCAERGLAPETTFAALLDEHLPAYAPGRLNYEARMQAGFSAAELSRLGAA